MTTAHRAYFGLVGLFALWVGVWGYAVPAEVGRALPWSVPPLHARFIASMYLAGLLAMALAFFARDLAAVRIPLALASIWTGALLIVSLLRLDAFDFAKPQVWFWMGAYAVYPLWGGWLYFRGGARERALRRASNDVPLAIVGAVLLALAAALFVAPSAMVGLWPWKVSPLLTAIYCGPFVAWGATALMLAREARPEARRIVLVAMLAFTLLALVASTLHAPLFRFDAPAAWLWFGGFAAWAVVVLVSLGRRARA